MTCLVCRRPVESGRPHTGCAPYLAVAGFVRSQETRGTVDRTAYVPEVLLTALLALLVIAVLMGVKQ